MVAATYMDALRQTDIPVLVIEVDAVHRDVRMVGIDNKTCLCPLPLDQAMIMNEL